MKKLLGLLSIFWGLSLTPLAQAANNLAVVNMQTIVQNSSEKKEADKNFEVKFKIRDMKLKKQKDDLEAKINNFKKNSPTMKETERNKLGKEIQEEEKTLITKLESLQNDASKFQSEEIKKIFGNIKNIVKSVALKKGYTTVVDSNTVIYSNPKDDITDDVLKGMKEFELNKAKK